jgi:predicted nucleotidyltransferase
MELINLEQLPNEVQKLVKPYAHNLIKVLGDNVCSIIVFGSAVGKDFIPNKSNVNLLVVLKEVKLLFLKNCHKLVSQGRKKGIVAPLFLTRTHIETSVDVFPIEYLEMKDFHIVIYGEPILSSIEIGGENLRLECEEQLKGKLIRLRQVYLEVGTNRKAIESVLIESLTSLIPAFRGMLRLVGKEILLDKNEVISAIAKEFKVDSSCFLYVLNIKSGKARLNKKDLDNFFEKYITEIEKLCIAMDRIEVAVPQGSRA